MGSKPAETIAANADAATEPATSTADTNSGLPAGHSSAALTADGLTFDLLQNAAYHADRLAHFTRLHRGVSFFTILLGTGGITAAVADSWVFGVIIGVAVAVLSSLDLAFDFRAQARLHERLRERVFAIMAELDEAGGDATRFPSIRGSLTRLFGEEPADMCAVSAMAYNAAIQATQRNVNPDDLIPLTFWQRLVRHWGRWPGQYLTVREIKEGGTKAASR